MALDLSPDLLVAEALDGEEIRVAPEPSARQVDLLLCRVDGFTTAARLEVTKLSGCGLLSTCLATSANHCELIPQLSRRWNDMADNIEPRSFPCWRCHQTAKISNPFWKTGFRSTNQRRGSRSRTNRRGGVAKVRGQWPRPALASALHPAHITQLLIIQPSILGLPAGSHASVWQAACEPRSCSGPQPIPCLNLCCSLCSSKVP